MLAKRTDFGPNSSRSGDNEGQQEVGDHDLLQRVKGKDAQAFRILVARHLPNVLSVARRILHDHSEAEDVAQEAMLRLWRSADTLAFDTHTAGAWLKRVAANLAIDRWRARRRLDVTDQVPDDSVRADQLDGLVAADLEGRVREAINMLPERQRLALVLFQYEGLSQIEIGAMLNISDEAVESLLARARRRLKQLLHDDWRNLLPGQC